MLQLYRAIKQLYRLNCQCGSTPAGLAFRNAGKSAL